MLQHLHSGVIQQATTGALAYGGSQHHTASVDGKTEVDGAGNLATARQTRITIVALQMGQ